MNYDQLFAGRFLKAGEFNGKPVTLTIARVYLEEIEQEDGTEKNQAIVAFKQTKREWALNKTNAQCLVAMWGNESDGWMGRKVTLHPERDVSGKSDSGLCIRVLGSPDLAEPIRMQVKLPRRKPINRTLEPTGKLKAEPPAGDEFADMSSSAAPIEPSGPLTLTCVSCGAEAACAPDATPDDLAGVSCSECGAEMTLS